MTSFHRPEDHDVDFFLVVEVVLDLLVEVVALGVDLEVAPSVALVVRRRPCLSARIPCE